MDYNLFPVFVEIMRHRNISRAAAALNITQPAASNALARLRHQFGDQLFIRTSHGVIPTQLATDIAADIEYHVEKLQLVTQTQSKRQANLLLSKRRFKIITHDMEEVLILPGLIAVLAEQAPHVQLEIRPYHRATFSQDLMTNQADIVMAYLRDIHKNLITKELLYQNFVCLCRKGSPLAKYSKLSMQNYVETPHMIISPDKGGFRGLVDEQLESLGLSRHVAISAPHFLSGCQMLSSSDYLMTLPRFVARQAVAAFDLKMFELPFELDGFSTSIHWHSRLDKDPEHKALRDLIVMVSANAHR